MKIYITEEDRVCHIQQAFHEHYPFLKLEFFTQPHEHRAPCPASQQVARDTPIEKIRMLHTFGWIDISPQRTAAEVEHDFLHEFGLSVQVFRKVGPSWIETTRTDDWPLATLNSEGRESTGDAHIYRIK